MTDPVTPEEARQAIEFALRGAINCSLGDARYELLRQAGRDGMDALDSLAAQLEAAQKRKRVLRDNLGAAPHPNLVSHPVYTVWYESSRDALDSPQTQGGSDA